VDYPIWDLPIGGGVLIGIVSIAHVLVAHFAVGGGLVIAITATLARRHNDRALRELARRGSFMLILISTVFGAISGVGIWVTIGLVSPTATSALIHNFVWGWAIEWCFFLVETATALAFFATWNKVRPRTHLLLIWLYSGSAFLSLVVIQGILSFMLTPGRWLTTHGFWGGFFNPTFAPGVVLRTGVSVLLAGAFLTLAAFREQNPNVRARLLPLLGRFQIIGAIMAYAGYRWWEAVLPSTVRALFSGDHPVLPALFYTRSVVLAGLTLFLLLALVPFLSSRRHRWPLAVIGLMAGCVVLGGYERLREGARKPFVIHDYMFSNGVLVGEIGSLNTQGILSKAHWAAKEANDSPEERGRAVFRSECRSCHTLDHYLSIRRLVSPPDVDRISGVLSLLREDGEKYVANRAAGMAASNMEGLNYSFMAPFVGTDAEMGALTQYLMSLGTPAVADAAEQP
jgi:cytochrome bd ubiquinol oxidase subunit I